MQTANPQEGDAPEIENQQHAYRTNRVPWFVYVLWLLFGVFAIGYIVTYLLPAIQVELVTPK